MFTARYVLHSTFCPQSVFMCFVWISEQTAIISPYSIDWLVFVTETECVYCAVRSTFYVLPTQCIYVFCVDLRTNSDYLTVQHWLVGFYNWDGECLLRGTGWVFIYNWCYFSYVSAEGNSHFPCAVLSRCRKNSPFVRSHVFNSVRMIILAMHATYIAQTYFVILSNWENY